MLFPRESSQREQKELNGLWRFQADWKGTGLAEEWYAAPLADSIPMPVPASYNDVTQDPKLRDHVGDVWYERSFRIPRAWLGRRLWIRFGSVTHHATVWLNGKLVGAHRGGFLPFDVEITEAATVERENRLTVKVNNVLDWSTLPPGDVVDTDDRGEPLGYKRQKYYHDFYHYAGIHRPVILYMTPPTYIKDITVHTAIEETTGVVAYEIEVEDGAGHDKGGSRPTVQAHLVTREGEVAASAEGVRNTIRVPQARFWFPGEPYLYTLEVRLVDDHGGIVDEYRLPVGIRTVAVQGGQFLINGKPFYFRGFGKHEDADIRGKGFDYVWVMKDVNLLAWVGANSFRTSHYPYADEMMDVADEQGIAVIDEVPAVGFNFWDKRQVVFSPERAGNPKMLETHVAQLRELILRDKNHPCVVMWNVANEAATYEAAARPYFERVVNEVRRLDPTRPVSIVEDTAPRETVVGDLADVIGVNRYFGWYTDTGDLAVIARQLEQDLRAWHERFGKPILVTEFGADAIAGFHQDPPVAFTEEYQRDLLAIYLQVLDRLPFVIGQHVWAFADFATKQGIMRVVGNRKGVFTRQRQPKLAAHLLREWWTRRAKTAADQGEGSPG
ncbi:MAG: beta-glucuronidase [Firmicutes bacterium]|nr:beta-glucuronidase [Bacillota bacterium]